MTEPYRCGNCDSDFFMVTTCSPHRDGAIRVTCRRCLRESFATDIATAFKLIAQKPDEKKAAT